MSGWGGEGRGTGERKCTRGSMYSDVQVNQGPCTREVRVGVLYRGERDRLLYKGTGDEALYRELPL